jgi:SAM-dependent methyltransferase
MSGAPYHRYVFDLEQRRFVGAFEDMYRAERAQGFDSWEQDDLRHLEKRVCIEVLAGRDYRRVLDVGCGKGAFTSLLKTRDNEVLAIDVSATAVEIARSRYPEIAFRQHDLMRERLEAAVGDGFDLIVCLETLSYLENWREQLRAFARLSRFCLVALYVPEAPIGFVKSSEELAEAFRALFTCIDEVRLTTRRQIILFGERRPTAER